MKKRLAAYLRVSSSASANNTSLDDQHARILKYAEAFDYEIVRVFKEVKSASGKVERKQFEAALKCMEDENLDGLIVYDIDRYFRNAADGLAVFRRYFQDSSYKFFSVNQNIATDTLDGWFMFGMFLLQAEYERLKIARRMNGGKQALADQGYTGQPHARFAERIELVQDGSKTRRLAVRDDHYAGIAETILTMRNAGHGWSDIARHLNDAGHRTKPSAKHPAGCAFDAKAVMRICLQQRSA